MFLHSLCFVIVSITITIAPGPLPANENENVALSVDEFNALSENDYFIFPIINDDSPLHRLWYPFNRIYKVFNYVDDYGKFDKTKHMRSVVPIFVQHGRFYEDAQQQLHTLKIEYHCYNIDSIEHDQRSLIKFYQHTQPSGFHNDDDIYPFINCRVYILFWQQPVHGNKKGNKQFKGYVSLFASSVYIRKTNPNQHILYIQHDGLPKGNNYEFWRESVHMFDPHIIDKFDHTYTFNPVTFKIMKHIKNPCQYPAFVNHDGIILIDKDVYPYFFIKEECLVNIHLKNIAKHFKMQRFRIEPLMLSSEKPPYFLGNIIPKKNHHQSDQTRILPSYEILGNHPNAQIAQIKWKKIETLSITELTKYMVESAPNCQCTAPPLGGNNCAELCSKTLYILPSSHDVDAPIVQGFLKKEEIEHILTELNTYKFEKFWNNGNVLTNNDEDAYVAALVAIDEDNTWVKNLILCQLTNIKISMILVLHQLGNINLLHDILAEEYQIY